MTGKSDRGTTLRRVASASAWLSLVSCGGNGPPGPDPDPDPDPDPTCAARPVWIETDPRVVDPGVAGSVTVRLRFVDCVASATLVPPGGGSGTPFTTEGLEAVLELSAARVLQGHVPGDPHNFVGFIELPALGGQDLRLNYFVNVLDPAAPATNPVQVDGDFQFAEHVANLRVGDAPPAFTVADLAQAVTQFSARLSGAFDFAAVVRPALYFENRTFRTLRNEIEGIGLANFDAGSGLGFPAGFQGVIDFPIGTLFDLASRGAAHEIGHRWINFLSGPTAGGAPHWPLSDLADGIMGFNIPGSGVGGSLLGTIVDAGAGNFTINCPANPPPRAFHDLELYMMGLLPPDSVGSHFVLANQAQTIPGCGGVLAGPAIPFTIGDVIDANGVRVPDTTTSQKDFRIATIVLSRGRLLTPTELRFFNHMASRGSGNAAVLASEGFVREMSFPFGPATGGRARLDTRVN